MNSTINLLLLLLLSSSSSLTQNSYRPAACVFRYLHMYSLVTIFDIVFAAQIHVRTHTVFCYFIRNILNHNILYHVQDPFMFYRHGLFGYIIRSSLILVVKWLSANGSGKWIVPYFCLILTKYIYTVYTFFLFYPCVNKCRFATHNSHFYCCHQQKAF
jgi:hypothetical protein